MVVQFLVRKIFIRLKVGRFEKCYEQRKALYHMQDFLISAQAGSFDYGSVFYLTY